jgi:nucleoside-diphosphate-sugar epimerase
MKLLDQWDLNFVVTGATGWIGRASLGLLDAKLGRRFGERVFAFASKAGTTRLLSGKTVSYSPLATITDLPQGRYIFLHCAFLGKERCADLSLADYVRSNEAISELVSTAARRVKTRSFFLPSSGAVYDEHRILTTDLERNPYGVMKLRDEERFRRLTEELRAPLVIARVFNIAGPYMNKLNSYALSSIIGDILARRSVKLRADRRVVRSYVHVNDLLALVWECLENAFCEQQLFDTTGETEIEIGDLARQALDILGWPEGAIERSPLSPDAVEDRYVGDNTVLSMLTARYGVLFRGLPEQIRDTAAYLAEPI